MIMDDPFVHFDRNRTNKMVQLMKEVGYERQILYFTCHDTMLNYWQKEQIVDIGALANEREWRQHERDYDAPSWRSS